MVLLSYNNGTVSLFQVVYAIALIVGAGNGFANGLLHWEISKVVKDYISWKTKKHLGEAPNDLLLIIVICFKHEQKLIQILTTKPCGTESGIF